MKKTILFGLLLSFITLTAGAQELRNGNNSTIGKIDSDGTVRNGNNSTIGYAKDVPKAKAAVFFFFDFFK